MKEDLIGSFHNSWYFPLKNKEGVEEREEIACSNNDHEVVDTVHENKYRKDDYFKNWPPIVKSYQEVSFMLLFFCVLYLVK